MANVRSKEKEEFWRLVLREFDAFGGSVREYCQKEGIAENSFYAWRREIARRDAERVRKDNDVAPSLVPVRVVDSTPAATRKSDPIEIQTPGGMIARLQEVLPKESLSELIGGMLLAESDVRQC